MKVISSVLSENTIKAGLLLEKGDIKNADIPGSVAEAISSYCAEAAGSKPVYPRVLSLDENPDGSVQFSFEALKMQPVASEAYKGVRVMADKEEDILPLALAAASESITVDIPGSVVEKRIDLMLTQKKVELMDDPVYGAITDVYAILLRLNDKSDSPASPEELWKRTLESAEEHMKTGSNDLNDFMRAIKDISGAADDEIELMVDDRISERQFMNPEDMAGQMLSAFFEINHTTMEGWRKNSYAAAEMQCRIDLLLDAIIDQEKLDVTQDEFEATLSDLAMQYQMPRSDIEIMVNREALEYQVKLEKAKKLVADNAVRF